jgi:hypothetical protein
MFLKYALRLATGFKPVILATWEVEIEGSWSRLHRAKHKTLSEK